ncbi:MAG: PatB family C-S lyase [Verrucomicrobiota bacterium JB022]|nr:PatB family C-S lyase [Verrucomicrobiota bacterium JB022]
MDKLVFSAGSLQFLPMSFDFETCSDRTGTGSLKWDKYRGRDVLPFWVADMDFVSPPPVLEALRARVDHGIFGYTLPNDEVVEAVLSYLQRVHGVKAEKEWLVWMPGLVPALNVSAAAFAEQGDEILTCTPVYPPFLSAPVWRDRTLKTVDLKLEDGRYTFDWEKLEAAVTPQTKIFILCNPHNPVGRVYTQEELERLADFCERHKLVLLSDEIHCDLILEPGAKHLPMLNVSESIASRTVAMYAPSKTYNLPGLACAFLVIPDTKVRAAYRLCARGLITEVNSFGYTGCAAAYNHGEPWRQELIGVLRANRDRLYAFVREHLPQVVMQPMEATYLAWLDVRALGLDNPVAHFEQHGIGLSNGGDFHAPGFLRFNFGCPPAMMEKGLERLKAAYDAAVAQAV